MSGQITNKTETTKTLKFVIKNAPLVSHRLGRISARHTFAIQKYLELLAQLDFTPTPGQLDVLTIRTGTRPSVQNDFKTLTGLNTCDLQCCGRAALRMWHSYQTHYRNWERRRDSASSSTIMRMLSEIEICPEGEVIKSSTAIEEAIETFSETRLWRRLQKKQPSPPLQSQKHKPKKIPMHFRYAGNLLAFQTKGVKNYYQFVGERLFVKLSTLKKGQPIMLELAYGEYHLRELEQARITGGKIVKNLAKDHWEFHASLRKNVPAYEEEVKGQWKQAILGVDLGIAVDATMVVLLEHEGLKQERFHFLKEPDLRRKKFAIEQTKKALQNKVSKTRGNERKELLRELRNSKNKYEILSNEACHKIAKRVAAIARNYLEEDYEVHVAIGQLRGLKNSVSKGDGKGKKFRGKISSFPYWKLTQYITYKCREVGVPEENIREVKESWTSKTCHKCGSTKTKRPTQAQFICLECGCKYNADANGAINIALRYWSKRACSSCGSLKTSYKKGGLIVCSECKAEFSIKENAKKNSAVVRMIFLSSSKKSEGLSKSTRPLLKVMEIVGNNSLYDAPLGTSDSPPCDESTGNEGLGKDALIPIKLKVEEAGKRKHFLKI